MAAFFYFRDMETLQEVFNRYDYFINGVGMTETYYEFQLEMSSIYQPSEIKALNMDMSFQGREFSNYLKSISRRLSSEFYTLIIIEAKNSPNSDYFYTKNIKKIEKIKTELSLKFPDKQFFLEDIEEILEDLKVAIDSETPKSLHFQNLEGKRNTNKIKWLGRTNVLATLFYDLLHGQDRGPSLIEATQEDVKNFLMNNFLDADGNDLTLDTVITYIRPDKVEKRAKRGDRIELGNVKLKNKLS